MKDVKMKDVKMKDVKMKDVKIFLKNNKKKSDNTVVNVTQTSQKMKKINWLNVEKKYYKMRKKRLIIIIRKYFDFKNFASL